MKIVRPAMAKRCFLNCCHAFPQSERCLRIFARSVSALPSFGSDTADPKVASSCAIIDSSFPVRMKARLTVA